MTDAPATKPPLLETPAIAVALVAVRLADTDNAWGRARAVLHAERTDLRRPA